MTAFRALPYPLKYAIVLISAMKSKVTVPRHKMIRKTDEVLEE